MPIRNLHNSSIIPDTDNTASFYLIWIPCYAVSGCSRNCRCSQGLLSPLGETGRRLMQKYKKHFSWFMLCILLHLTFYFTLLYPVIYSLCYTFFCTSVCYFNVSLTVHRDTFIRTIRANRMKYLLSIYFSNEPLHVWSRFTAHHQEVKVKR